MVDLADAGESDSEDDGCRVLYGQIIDSAYKIKQLAEAEKEKHINKGAWELYGKKK